VKKHPTKS
jgi:(S)-2-hydroxy-acid oxidase